MLHVLEADTTSVEDAGDKAREVMGDGWANIVFNGEVVVESEAVSNIRR
jgi:hypothetical protein